MSKINEQVNEAVLAGRSCGIGNTQVIADGDDITVLLHGNRIAYTNEHGRLCMDRQTLHQWHTNTTRDRLNGLGFRVGTYLNYPMMDGIPVSLDEQPPAAVVKLHDKVRSAIGSTLHGNRLHYSRMEGDELDGRWWPVCWAFHRSTVSHSVTLLHHAGANEFLVDQIGGGYAFIATKYMDRASQDRTQRVKKGHRFTDLDTALATMVML